jgi:hypothetical protein
MWRRGRADPPTARLDPWLLGILALSVVLNGWHLTWGLPNGNRSWAADAIGPVTALSVARHTFAGFNSGWFYFKYPPGWSFLLVAAYLPYLAFLYASGGWRNPTAQYPYGFADPEQALFVLAMIGRVIAVAFGVGIVALAYGIAARLFDRSTARSSAWLVATAYPIIYYAHTTNLDISYCFWLILALYAAIAAAGVEPQAGRTTAPAAGSGRPLPWAVLGIAAAMALSTKEQGFAWLVPLPIMALATRVRQRGRLAALLERPTWLMCAAGLATLLVANNALVNPLGFASRIAYLLGHPLQPTEARLAPVEFALWKGAKEWRYVDHLWVSLDSSLGLPVLVLAGAGALAVWRRPHAALWLLLPVWSLYYLSLRGLELITLRYVLPITVVAMILVATVLVWLREIAPRGAARTVATALLVLVASYGLARAVELEWLLFTDSRYQAEAWMAEHLPNDARAEVYQKPAFLPRFRDGLTGTYVPIGERSLAGVAQRRPHAIVTSSASHKSITHRWTPDWRETGDMLQPEPAAVELLQALEAGHTAYRAEGVFRQDPLLIRNRITSLAPEIVIYVRQP